MYDLEQAIDDRRSIRMFLPDRPVPRDLVDQALAPPARLRPRPERLVAALLDEATSKPPVVPELPRRRHVPADIPARVDRTRPRHLRARVNRRLPRDRPRAQRRVSRRLTGDHRLPVGLDQKQLRAFGHLRRVGAQRHHDLVAGVAHHVQRQLERSLFGEVRAHARCYLRIDA